MRILPCTTITTLHPYNSMTKLSSGETLIWHPRVQNQVEQPKDEKEKKFKKKLFSKEITTI